MTFKIIALATLQGIGIAIIAAVVATMLCIPLGLVPRDAFTPLLSALGPGLILSTSSNTLRQRAVRKHREGRK